jgi:UDP-N-acetylmuramoyl-tripeptide--D-alanyl-D-alanine ligase
LSLWTSEEIARATSGESAGAFSATGVSIDTRSLQPGDLFVALGGARDGHEFLEQAFAKGAAGALVSRRIEGGPAVVVSDVQAGLEALGLAARDRSRAKRAAVTGSVGKTSVTQAVRAALALAGSAHASVKSYNNHIGVPLTLARMPRGTERAVFEIGMNHAGEITPLSRMVRPHAALITTVGPVHVENFPEGEPGVARAKAEVFAGLEPGGAAVLNADNPWFDLLKGEAERVGARVLSFGTGERCDARLIDITAGEGGLKVRAEVGASLWVCNCFNRPSLGPEQPRGSTARRSAGRAAGDDRRRAGGVRTARWPRRGAHRRALGRRLHAGGRKLQRQPALDDGGDPQPGRPAHRRAAHRRADRHAGARPRLPPLPRRGGRGPDAAGIDLVFAAGPHMASLFDALSPTQRGGYAESAAALAPRLAAEARPGDLIMVKGSNGSKANLLAQALAALHAHDGT